MEPRRRRTLGQIRARHAGRGRDDGAVEQVDAVAAAADDVIALSQRAGAALSSARIHRDVQDLGDRVDVLHVTAERTETEIERLRHQIMPRIPPPLHPHDDPITRSRAFWALYSGRLRTTILNQLTAPRREFDRAVVADCIEIVGLFMNSGNYNIFEQPALIDAFTLLLFRIIDDHELILRVLRFPIANIWQLVKELLIYEVVIASRDNWREIINLLYSYNHPRFTTMLYDGLDISDRQRPLTDDETRFVNARELETRRQYVSQMWRTARDYLPDRTNGHQNPLKTLEVALIDDENVSKHMSNSVNKNCDWSTLHIVTHRLTDELFDFLGDNDPALAALSMRSRIVDICASGALLRKILAMANGIDDFDDEDVHRILYAMRLAFEMHIYIAVALFLDHSQLVMRILWRSIEVPNLITWIGELPEYALASLNLEFYLPEIIYHDRESLLHVIRLVNRYSFLINGKVAAACLIAAPRDTWTDEEIAIVREISQIMGLNPCGHPSPKAPDFVTLYRYLMQEMTEEQILEDFRRRNMI